MSDKRDAASIHNATWLHEASDPLDIPGRACRSGIDPLRSTRIFVTSPFIFSCTSSKNPVRQARLHISPKYLSGQCFNCYLDRTAISDRHGNVWATANVWAIVDRQRVDVWATGNARTCLHAGARHARHNRQTAGRAFFCTIVCANVRTKAAVEMTARGK
jgi:hypothetical protein